MSSILPEILKSIIPDHTSDIHLTPGMPPVLRTDGVLSYLGDKPVSEDEVKEVAKEIATPPLLNELEKKGEVDFAVTYADVNRMRCNIYKSQEQTVIAIRLLPITVPTAESIGLPKVLVEQADKPRGLVLVTGPTGSGKSTTLAALIDHINHTSRRHIITLENPIEYVHKPDLSIIHQREIGIDTESFSSGLRASLRQDPDVILLGEMRDLETISTAIMAAETGHLVFGTLHTKGAPNTVDRIVDVFPSDQQDTIRIQLADVLECVIGQTLLPKISGGRCAAYEIMLGTSAVRSLIRQNKSFQLSSTMQTSRKQGMITLDDALADLVYGGLVRASDAAMEANKPSEIIGLRSRMKAV